MNILTSDFDCNYHSAQIVGNNTHGRYTLHNIDVYNVISIDETDLNAVYQCGASYDYNDYDCPSPRLALSESGGTSKVLLKIDKIYSKDFEDSVSILETLEEIQDMCPAIDSIEKLKAVYDALNDNKPVLSDFLDSDC
jgi:hypothetical protein